MEVSRSGRAPPRRTRCRTLGALLAGGLVASSLQCCARKHPPAMGQSQPEARKDAPTPEAFRKGNAVLGCSSACEAEWTGSRARMRSLYDALDWGALAADVTRIGFEQDLAYFYLGRAAEGLHLYDAALSYYRTAVQLSTKGDQTLRCRAKSDRCDGVLLPADALPRISMVAAQLVRAKSLASVRRNGSGTSSLARQGSGIDDTGGPKAEPQPNDSQVGGTLIDPPPVAP